MFGLAAGSHSVRTNNIHRIQRVFALAHFTNEEYTLYLACVWARTLEERRIYIVFIVCSRSHALRTHALRTKNIHGIQRLFALFTLAPFKNEEYTLYSARVLARTL